MSPRTVFDCSVLIQGAARKTGPAAACLRLAKTGHVELYLSPQVIAEVQDVLTRAKTQKKFSTLTPKIVQAFLEDVKNVAVLISDVPKVFTLKRDAKDEPYLDLAFAAGARYLVSRDKDLLDLMKEDSQEAIELRRRMPNLVILDPVAFLQEVSSQRQREQSSG